MKIKLEHLGYTVYVKKPIKNEMGFKIWTSRVDDNSSIIYIPMPIERINTPTLAHEVVHVLQNISMTRDIHFHEQEHFGYLMQYIMAKALGYEYDI